MLKGSIVALITPFEGEKLSESTYIKLINYHLDNGTNGVVPGGTTGESPTLSHNEHKKIIEIAIRECKEKFLLLQVQDQILQMKPSSYQCLLKRLVQMLCL